MHALLRPELTPMPPRIARLPVMRGYPVPWFVQWIDGEPEFRLADPEKHRAAIREKRCWVCGDILGGIHTFVIGPMCVVNRTSGDPPCHTECAVWSVQNCPFLTRPNMVRREDDVTAEAGCAGTMIKRNPGVMCAWSTKTAKLFRVDNGVLFDIGEPVTFSWWREGRPATAGEVAEGFHTGLPLLMEMAEKQGAKAVSALEEAVERARPYLLV